MADDARQPLPDLGAGLPLSERYDFFELLRRLEAQSGQSSLLLSALLARLFARHSGINGFVRTRTRLLQKQEDVPWPMTPGNRFLI
ncbi:type VI secretion system baseplate subunit TssF [Aminobacter sp. Piv2-1]|uniref:type VI secretion system baseplate subunit TssF n=1 Tax=Aminobacter sp. Piv2-1 TaxID=3031122 RepID=UPI0030AB31D1